MPGRRSTAGAATVITTTLALRARCVSSRCGPLSFFAQAIEHCVDLRPKPSKLLLVRGRKLLKPSLSALREQDIHLSAIAGCRLTGQQPMRDQAIHHPYRAVVPNLKSLRQLADRDPVAPGKSLHCQQCLMLLRFDSLRAG